MSKIHFIFCEQTLKQERDRSGPIKWENILETQ